jgi:transcriptional regulator of met regulon
MTWQPLNHQFEKFVKKKMVAIKLSSLNSLKKRLGGRQINNLKPLQENDLVATKSSS